jgi:hypothetical protein
MSRLRANHVAGFEESDFSHYQKVTKVTSSRDFRLLTPPPASSRLGALQ